MKNILTIAITAGLLSAFASSVQAQTSPIAVGGLVTQSCIIDTLSSSGGFLAENALPASTLSTASGPAATLGVITVKCNASPTTLTITPGILTVPTGQTPAPTAVVRFVSGGTGVYSAVSSGTTATAIDTTSAAGDTAKFSTTITAGAGKLLKVGSYSIVVNAAVTP
jgi:hypothetical protein